MRLPHAESAVIDSRKLTLYLLSTEHISGRYKAAYFGQAGFSIRHWELLAGELRRLALEEAERGERTPFGQKYLTRGRIVGPTGRALTVTAVWIVLNGEEIPRLVTAYPGA
jgi:hypothetical protein